MPDLRKIQDLKALANNITFQPSPEPQQTQTSTNPNSNLQLQETDTILSLINKPLIKHEISSDSIENLIKDTKLEIFYKL